jgi:hypothetical protein
MLKNPAKYKRGTASEKLTDISCQVFSASLPGVCVGFCPRTLVDESKRLELRQGTQNRPVMVAVLITPSAIPSRNSNSKLV